MDDEETAQIPDLKEMKTLIARRFKAEGYKGPFSTIEKKAKAILDQRDMLNTFSTLEKTGCTVRYYPCDVNSREKLSATMEQIRQELGEVTGIIHGAGLLADCKIWNKEMARFRAVLDTKYVGLNNILSCVNKEQLKLVVSFSSVAGYFGNDGQMDYAAGNEFLAKFAYHFRKKYPNCKALTINWGAWDGGMMDYIYRKTLTEKGYVLIPLDVGANYFANEFLNGLPSSQILISNNDKPVDLTRPAE
jgi:NAD(P)-dependent dehydrogenase (short-subunit alcohol dehydrogenase family)